MFLGTPVGPKIPYQVFNSKPGTVSAMAGTVARIGVRFNVVVPKGINLLA